MNKSSKRLIKNYWILPKFQKKVIAVSLGTGLIVFLFGIISLSLLIHRLKILGLESGFNTDHHYFQFVQDLGVEAFGMFLLLTFIAMGVALVTQIYVSHKIAGPIYKVYQYFKGIDSAASFSPIAFRKGDYIEDLAPIINNALVNKFKRE
jgi:hypothetical protein